MSIKNLSVSCGLPQQTIKLFKNEGFIDGFAASAENEAKIDALKYLFMSRFSLAQVKTMFTRADSLADPVKAHIDELSGDGCSYPALIRILTGVDMNEVQDVFALGRKIGEFFVLPADASRAVSALKKGCSEIEAYLLQARKYYRAENVIYPIALIPVIGFPFGLIRSQLLSQMGDRMNSADALSRPFAEALGKIEPFLDFSSLSYQYGYDGRNYGQASPNAAAICYSLDVDERFTAFWERLNSVKRLLESLKFYSEVRT